MATRKLIKIIGVLEEREAGNILDWAVQYFLL